MAVMRILLLRYNWDRRVHHGGLSSYLYFKDRTVDLGPFLGLYPGLGLGRGELVADKEKRGWSWKHSRPCD